MRTSIIALLVTAGTSIVLPAMAQQTAPGNASVPSSQNSGAGTPGYPGNKNGPAPDKATVGSSSSNQNNLSVKEQDSANIKGLPGNKSGPPARTPH